MDDEQRPLDIREQVALAETVRRLTAENAGLRGRKAKRERQKLSFKKAVRALLPFVLVLAAVPAVAGLCMAGRWLFHKDRTTTCYFVRHHASAASDREAEPWEPWHVYRTDCSSCFAPCFAQQVIDTKFSSRDEAWSFIQKWKLEACK